MALKKKGKIWQCIGDHVSKIYLVYLYSNGDRCPCENEDDDYDEFDEHLYLKTAFESKNEAEKYIENKFLKPKYITANYSAIIELNDGDEINPFLEINKANFTKVEGGKVIKIEG